MKPHTIPLPAFGKWPKSATSPTASEPKREKAPLVMILDDDLYVLRFLGALLERKGIHVLPFLWAEHALAAYRLQRERIGMVITDIQLGTVDGVEVARQIRCLNPDLPVLLTSASTPEAYRNSPPEFPLLHKPFRLDAFDEAFQPLYARAKECAPLVTAG